MITKVHIYLLCVLTFFKLFFVHVVKVVVVCVYVYLCVEVKWVLNVI